MVFQSFVPSGSSVEEKDGVRRLGELEEAGDQAEWEKADRRSCDAKENGILLPLNQFNFLAFPPGMPLAVAVLICCGFRLCLPLPGWMRSTTLADAPVDSGPEMDSPSARGLRCRGHPP